MQNAPKKARTSRKSPAPSQPPKKQAIAAAKPSQTPPEPPKSATGPEAAPASMSLTPDQLRQIKAANIQNIVNRLKAGGTISKQERIALEESASPPQQPPRQPDIPAPILNMVGVLPDPVEIAKHQRPDRTRKATAKEIRERVEIVTQLIGVKTKTQIHDFCWIAWGVVWQTADEYSRRAREAMLEACDSTKPEMRARNYRLYCAIIADPTASHFEKLRAIQRIDDLFGLNAPQQHRVEASGPGGGPIKQEISGASVMLYLPDNGRYNPDPAKKHAKDPIDRATAPEAPSPRPQIVGLKDASCIDRATAPEAPSPPISTVAAPKVA
jgi:hypothetical protein